MSLGSTKITLLFLDHQKSTSNFDFRDFLPVVMIWAGHKAHARASKIWAGAFLNFFRAV